RGRPRPSTVVRRPATRPVRRRAARGQAGARPGRDHEPRRPDRPGARRETRGEHTAMTGERLSCEYLSDTLTVLCDGNVTCGLDDPNGTRSFGNVEVSSVDAIWRDLRYAERKQRLAEGTSCDGCSLHRVVQGAMPERAPAPRRLIVEATVVCNIR